jgi:hypothetical protein
MRAEGRFEGEWRSISSSSRAILKLVVLQGYCNLIHDTAARFASQEFDLQQELSICGEEGRADAAQEDASFWRGRR